MLHLLIVEDEEQTRQGLRNYVDWEIYGVCCVGEAENGIQALDFLQNNKVDIVISDVSMPILDGIQMVQKIRELGIVTKIIFISGHADLLYLKTAFKLDVVDYILKPIDLQELDTVIKKVTGICEEEATQNRELSEMREMLSESMPVLRERFLLRLLEGKLSKQEIDPKINFLSMSNLKKCFFTVLSIELGNHIEHKQGITPLDLELVLLKIQRAIEDLLDEFNYISVSPDDGMLSVIISSQTSICYERILDLSQNLLCTLTEKTGYILTMGVGREVSQLADVSLSYCQSISALEQRFFFGEGQVIHMDDFEKPRFKGIFYPAQIIDKILEALRTGNIKNLHDNIDALFLVLTEGKIFSLDYIQNICLEILVMANKYMLELKVSDQKGTKGAFLWQQLFTMKTLLQTTEWLKETLTQMAKSVETIQSNSSNNIVELMKKSIRERYDENLTTQKLAEEFFITPNYICLLFKKETGETFNDFLTRTRMDKAKDLLKNTTMKLYEISERVGFQDVNYFGRLFKKVVGLSPSEYRDKI